MRPVPVPVRVLTPDEAAHHGGPALEFLRRRPSAARPPGQAFAWESARRQTYPVGGIDARVNHVRARALARAAVVDVRVAPGLAVRDAPEALRRAGLLPEGVDGEDGVLLHVVDLRPASATTEPRPRPWPATNIGPLSKSLDVLGAELPGEAADRVLVHVVGLAGQGAHHLVDGLMDMPSLNLTMYLPAMSLSLPRGSSRGAGSSRWAAGAAITADSRARTTDSFILTLLFLLLLPSSVGCSSQGLA